MPVNLHLLHGFLGRPQDWNVLFPENAGSKTVRAVDLFRFILPYKEWTKKFNEETASCKCPGKNILIGYSLGGRLALHALVQNPALWDAAVIISANPGLGSEKERTSRITSDKAWAAKFESEPWNELMDAWNGQAVFGSDKTFLRREEDYNRRDLADSLSVWSLGLQEPLQEKIAQLEMPILWMAGESDTKFCQLARAVQLKHPQSRVSIISQAGHRVPWEQPREFLSQVNKFINQENL